MKADAALGQGWEEGAQRLACSPRGPAKGKALCARASGQVGHGDKPVCGPPSHLESGGLPTQLPWTTLGHHTNRRH